MVDYIKLQEVINNNENFKKSPKIRKLFDYDLYEINNKDMYFVYKDFKCENIFKDVDKYYIYILYFYLMECNITRNDKIQQNGGQLEVKNEPEAPAATPEAPAATPEAPAATPEAPAATPEAPAATPEAPAATPEEPAATPEAPAATPEAPAATPEAPAATPEAPAATPEAPAATPEAEATPEEATPEPAEEPVEVQPDIEKDQVMGVDPDDSDPVSDVSDPVPEDVLDDEMKQLEDEEEDKEETEDMEEQLEIANEIELPGFEEYEETRMKLDMKSSVVNGNIKITNSDLIKYKVNWFNVCMGIDIFDTGFENKVSTKMEEIGLKPFKRDKFLEKIELILNDKEMTSNFKNAIYERLMENCKEPEDFIDNKKKCESTDSGPIDKFLGLFRKCHEEEMKDNDGILYLYDKYKTILNRNTTIISNVDLILIILNCEIRQRILLSYHISVEIIRRRNNENKTVNSILENIYEIDKPVIEEVEKELRNKIAQEKIERMKIIEQVNKEEIERRKEEMIRKPEPELIRAILEKQKDPNNTMVNEEIKQFVGRNDKINDDFIGEHRNNLKNQRFDMVAAAAAGGGNPESDPISDLISPENEGELSMLQSDMFGDNIQQEKNHIYDIHNRNTQSEFCNSIGDIVTKRHLKSPHLLDKCKNF